MRGNVVCALGRAPILLRFWGLGLGPRAWAGGAGGVWGPWVGPGLAVVETGGAEGFCDSIIGGSGQVNTNGGGTALVPWA